MNNKICEKTVDSKDALMDLVVETFVLIADNIELYYENRRLRIKVKRLEAFIRGMGKGY